MKIVIDMQGAQSPANGNRGIGRYTVSLAQALVRSCAPNEQIVLALNAGLEESAQSIRNLFKGLLPQEQIQAWTPISPSGYLPEKNIWRRKTNELMREAFLASLAPDIVLVSSLFEGLSDNAITSVNRFSNRSPTAIILYDLIPFIHQEAYLGDASVKAWYLEKIQELQRADRWLAISESSADEGIKHLALPSDYCRNISTDADPKFKPISLSAGSEHAIRQKYSIQRSFVMYTGGIDKRKNIEGLIGAYALLPRNLRRKHQLTIVCSATEESLRRLRALAANRGLDKDELVLTGFVPDEDLIVLYNLCTVFVFPSWHEGFGLPALEAMRCGAPVIASNTSSLPEVVGISEAQFDPYSEQSIATAIEHVLTDPSLRSKLIENARYQGTRFSWDNTAQAALKLMNEGVSPEHKNGTTQKSATKRPRLAYISPLPPIRSGIADYSVGLLNYLIAHYDIEVIVAQDIAAVTWIYQQIPIRTEEWFRENYSDFDRIIYHFGNSVYHMHMFELLRDIPGVVVLHDFYLSGILQHMQAIGYEANVYDTELYKWHGYAGLRDHYFSKDPSESEWKYPCSRSVISNSIGTIVHSQHGQSLARQWYDISDKDCAVVPLLRENANAGNNALARKFLDLSEDVFIVCTYGFMGPTKLNHRLLRAWLASDLSSYGQCLLIYVGENHPGEYGKSISAEAASHPNGASVKITGWVDTELYHRYLEAADLAVQLRAQSKGETSAAVLDCMNYSLPTIVNNHGSMAELDNNAVWKLPDAFEEEDLVLALHTLWKDRNRRNGLGSKAKQSISESHNAPRCAKEIAAAIESFYKRKKPILNELIAAASCIQASNLNQSDLICLSQAIATNFPPKGELRTLFVDVSELAKQDAQTGIQRVVRSILVEWLSTPPKGWRIEPVFATTDCGFRYARSFTSSLLGFRSKALLDEPIDYANGDIFFALDWQAHVQIHHSVFLQKLRRHGVHVKFMVYDLLCITQSQHFPPGASSLFSEWLRTVCESDGAICISKTVMDELYEWMGKAIKVPSPTFNLNWGHLGSDFSVDISCTSLPPTAGKVLAMIRGCVSFLMVSTIEPRKGHAQVLDAFEELWRSGVTVNLIIVGKEGWMVDHLMSRIRNHPELGNHLFFLEGINDLYLREVYSASTCLIAASYGEGFGLPLIEAAKNGLPLMARDIPVFREVAGDHAFYFKSQTSSDLAANLEKWIELYQDDAHPKSDEIHWLSWKESALNFFSILTAAT